MKVVKVEILPAKDDEVVTATIIEQTNKDGNWMETANYSAQSGTVEARRTILLDEDDRVIIEGKVEHMTVYDPGQMSAKKVPLGAKAEEAAKYDEEQKKKHDEMVQKEKDDLEEKKPEELKLREAQAKTRDEAIMGKPKEAQPTDARTSSLDATRSTAHSPQQTFGQDKDSGLRTDTPKDSKSVKDEGSGTKTSVSKK